ncbi:hypothetical protein [Escherichia coli]|uniref:hypothetical protein n=1 Tax=Escherichia coli TaxID=562 RepID=UPI00207D2F1E|nr:hypothetical protein [Escherichia coli]MED6520127.1 hypothetical protein [Escherichia coli O157]
MSNSNLNRGYWALSFHENTQPNRGPGHMLTGDNTDENKQPNLGKDVASATDKDKAELGGAGAGTPGGWGPDNEEKARHQEVQQQRFDELSKSHPA